jgi:AhpD family alkylhydroperoxidase
LPSCASRGAEPIYQHPDRVHVSVKNVTAKGTEIAMDARLNYPGTTIAANFGKYLNSAGQAVTDSSLPAATQALLKIRASQINGCAPCTDPHTKDTGHAGESSVRLNLVAAWREATAFTNAERRSWSYDLAVLAGLGHIGVGIEQGMGAGIFGEEGKHRAGALAAAGHVALSSTSVICRRD